MATEGRHAQGNALLLVLVKNFRGVVVTGILPGNRVTAGTIIISSDVEFRVIGFAFPTR